MFFCMKVLIPILDDLISSNFVAVERHHLTVKKRCVFCGFFFLLGGGTLKVALKGELDICLLCVFVTRLLITQVT